MDPAGGGEHGIDKLAIASGDDEWQWAEEAMEGMGKETLGADDEVASLFSSSEDDDEDEEQEDGVEMVQENGASGRDISEEGAGKDGEGDHMDASTSDQGGTTGEDATTALDQDMPRLTRKQKLEIFDRESAGGKGGKGAGRPYKKKKKRGRPSKSDGPKLRDWTTGQLEYEIAMNVGLDGMALAEDEEQVLPLDVDQDNYVKVRNHILARWRSDVNRYLSIDAAGSKVMTKFAHLVPLAWRFLDRFGYINFGASPGLLATPHPNAPEVEARESVIVVGAGLAGIAAARQLHKWGYKVIVLEGRNRPGGRLYTTRLEGSCELGQVAGVADLGGSIITGIFGNHLAVLAKQLKGTCELGQVAGVADLGGSIITGIFGNPLAVLAKQLKVPMHEITNTCPLYLDGGVEANKSVDEAVEKQYNEILSRCDKYRDDMGDVADYISLGTALDTLWADVPKIEGGMQAELQQQLFHWHMANAEFANAACVVDLSLRHWDQDDPYEMAGPHVFLPVGLSLPHWDQDDPYEMAGPHVFLPGLTDDLPIMYNSIVKSIDYPGQGQAAGVSITCADGSTYTADAAVLTIPLGVLKKGTVAFNPPLPEAKQEAIHRLGYGVLNKLVMLFPEVFWDDSCDTFGHVVEDPADRGLFYLFYSYSGLAGGAVLAALVAGEAAVKFEEMPTDQALEQVMRVLRGIHGPKGITVPDPVQPTEQALEKVLHVLRGIHGPKGITVPDPVQPTEQALEQEMRVLRGILGPQGITVPDPVQAVCTRWASDPMSYGSYSSISVGSLGAEDYDNLAASVGGRLFFAGEATQRKWPATMHGAFMSGLREAANVTLAFEKEAAAPRPAYTQHHTPTTSAIDSALAKDEEAAPAVKSKIMSPRRHAPSARVLQLAIALKALFKEVEADMEFGSFAVLFAPKDLPTAQQQGPQVAPKELPSQQGQQPTSPSPVGGGRAIVQIQMGNMRNGPRHNNMALYVVLNREQDVRGGDSARLSVLTSDFGVKLINRLGPDPELEALLKLISVERKVVQDLVQAIPPVWAPDQAQGGPIQNGEDIAVRDSSSDWDSSDGDYEENGGGKPGLRWGTVM
eukprot:gene8635-34083_t